MQFFSYLFSIFKKNFFFLYQDNPKSASALIILLDGHLVSWRLINKLIFCSTFQRIRSNVSSLDNGFFVPITGVSCWTSDMTACVGSFPRGNSFPFGLCVLCRWMSPMFIWLSFSTATGRAFHCWIMFLSVLNCILSAFSLLTDPVLQVPTHVAEYVPLSCFSALVYVYVPFSTAPVCNKRGRMQMVMVTCWACLVCHSFYWSRKVMHLLKS